MTDKEFEKWEQERNIGQEILEGIREIQAGKTGRRFTVESFRKDMWHTLINAYKQPYDPRSVIEQVVQNRFDQNAWNELWNELHHQGDVASASYAAVPLLVEGITDRLSDYNFYGLIATIEIQRNIGNNPPLPEWLEKDYLKSIEQCVMFAHEDFSKSDLPQVTQTTMTFFAIEKNDFQLARVFLESSRDSLVKTMEDYIGL